MTAGLLNPPHPGVAQPHAQELRAFQARAVRIGLDAAAKPRTRVMLVAGTGTGKGTSALALLRSFDELRCWFLTPSLEILRGMLARSGVDLTGLSESTLHAACWCRGMSTPVRFRNRIRAGKIPAPLLVIYDEGHHATESNVVTRDIARYCPEASWVAFTATPYRGTHRQTEALREFWGEPVPLLSIRDAAQMGYLSVPTGEMLPIIDDSALRVGRDGEFEEADADAAVRAVLEPLADAIARRCGAGPGAWLRPTLVAVPTRGVREALVAALERRGLGAADVSALTPRLERDRALDDCRHRRRAIIQIAVLSEGVDMPWARVLVDARPLKSPVAWMQLLGRITRPVRPGEEPPEYLCTCRNLARHSHLLGDVWPARRHAVDCLASFGGGGDGGGGADALERGLAGEVFKRLGRSQVKLRDGGYATLVHLGDPVTGDEVLAVGVPGESAPRVFRRPTRPWGPWEVSGIDPSGYRGWARPTDPDPLSDSQRAWWVEAAARCGLDPGEVPTRREFPVLPALSSTGTTLADPAAREAAPDMAAGADAPDGFPERAADPRWEGLAPAGRYGEVVVQYGRAGARWAGYPFLATRGIPVGDPDRRRALLARCAVVARHRSIESGGYVVSDGDREVPLWVDQGAGRWEGWTFVEARGERVSDSAAKARLLALVASDPAAARARYSELFRR